MINYIKINTNRLNTDAETVAGMISGIKTELNGMKQNVAQLDSMWDGPSSEAFKKAFQDDMNAMETIIKNIESIHSYEVNAKSKYESCENRVSGIVAGIRV